MFAPLPPQGTGVADYMRDLLPHLAALADVDLYRADGYFPDAQTLPPECLVYPESEFLRRRAERGYTCAVYHLGNSPYHRSIYNYAVHYPGVVVLHDQVLHHLVAGMAEEGRSGFYFREMAYAVGGHGVHQAWDVLMGDWEAPFFTYALNQRVLDASLGVAVHSRYLAQALQAQAPAARVGHTPMGIPLPPNPGEKPELRRRLGLPQQSFLVGSFGQATRQKRLPAVLHALAALVAEGVDAHYVVVGNVARDLDIGAEAAALGLAGRVTVTGYVDDAAFNAYLHAVDVCVNLRYPTAGETSAAALRCMAAGQPVLVSAVGANLEFPDTACLKLPVNGEEAGLLKRTLHTLHAEPEARRSLGAAARAYVQTEHSMAAAAHAFLQFVEQCVSLPALISPLPHNAPPASPLVRDVAGALASMGLTARDTPYLRGLAEALAFVEPSPAGAGGPSQEEVHL